MPKLVKLDNQTINELLAKLLDVQAGRPNAGVALQEAIVTLEEWAEATAEPERVIFRKFPSDGAVIALFPDQYDARTGYIGSYMELGQHSDTVPDFGDTKPAEAHEYRDLYNELVRQGYHNLKVVKRLTIRK